MVFLRMMRLIENKEIDLVHPHIRIEEALVQYICRAYYNHVLIEVFGPCLFAPQIWSHGTKYLSNVLIDVVAQNSCLLKYKCDTIDLGYQLAIVV